MLKAWKYIVDENGRKESVIVPVKGSKQMISNCRKAQRKLEILSGITDGLEEVAEAKRTEKKLQTLHNFLHEISMNS